MSQKEACPACNSYTSAIREAFEWGQPCPYCGLSGETAKEIALIRKARNDDALSERFETLAIERDRAVMRAEELEHALRGLLQARKAAEKAAQKLLGEETP